MGVDDLVPVGLELGVAVKVGVAVGVPVLLGVFVCVMLGVGLLAPAVEVLVAVGV